MTFEWALEIWYFKYPASNHASDPFHDLLVNFITLYVLKWPKMTYQLCHLKVVKHQTSVNLSIGLAKSLKLTVNHLLKLNFKNLDLKRPKLLSLWLMVKFLDVNILHWRKMTSHAPSMTSRVEMVPRSLLLLNQRNRVVKLWWKCDFLTLTWKSLKKPEFTDAKFSKLAEIKIQK